MSSLHVIKVGGSLLDLPDLPRRLAAVLRQAGPGRRVLLAGGGRLADAVRDYDAQWRLPEDVSHRMALDAMRATAKLLAQLTGLPLLDSVPAPDEPEASAVLNPCRLLERDEPRAAGSPLAASWSAAGDAIAARIAEIHAANELWLLKSVDAPGLSADELARRGIVDRDFPDHAQALRWRIINLRCGAS